MCFQVLKILLDDFKLFVLAIWVALEKKGIPYHDAYNSKAGIDFRLGKIIFIFFFVNLFY